MTGIIIQARMNSTRLPGKVLMPVGKRLLLEHIMFRLGHLLINAKVVIATTTSKIDDTIEGFCKTRKVDCFRGDEHNVLERYYLCAKEHGFKDIVRLTGDNPFPDIDEMKRLISLHKDNLNDYTECFTVLPIGAGMEVFTFAALKRSYEMATKPHHFEHVNEFMLEHMDVFKCETLGVPDAKSKPKFRLTVDTREDYEHACFIATNAATEYVTTYEAIRLSEQYRLKNERTGGANDGRN